MENKEKWMQFALREAEKAGNLDEVPIGSIIIKDDKIIGRGYNQTESLNDCTAHAEIIAITSAENYLNNWRLNKCSIYVTKEPCTMCFGAILNSRIENIYFGLSDKKNGFRIKMKKNNIFSSHLRLIESGLLENDAKYILQNFFINKRKK